MNFKQKFLTFRCRFNTDSLLCVQKQDKMKLKNIILIAVLVGGAYYAYSLFGKTKKTKVIKDRSFEIEIEEPETEK